MQKISLTLAFLALAMNAPAASDLSGPNVAPDAAWHLLSEGNDRFAQGMALKPHQDPDHRRALAHSEEPFAVVVADSDSRVVPEMIFDQDLGDLEDVRNAGNPADGDYAVGSIEHAVKALGVRLVVVLGSEKAWAVVDSVKGMKKDDKTKIDDVAAHLKPAADEAGDKVAGLSGSNLVSAAVERNVLYQMRNLLKESPYIDAKVESGDVKVIGGVYTLENGRVRWLGEHPSQQEILDGKMP